MSDWLSRAGRTSVNSFHVHRFDFFSSAFAKRDRIKIREDKDGLLTYFSTFRELQYVYNLNLHIIELISVVHVWSM